MLRPTSCSDVEAEVFSGVPLEKDELDLNHQEIPRRGVAGLSKIFFSKKARTCTDGTWGLSFHDPQSSSKTTSS